MIDFQAWRKRMLSLMRRNSQAEDDEWHALVDMAENTNDIRVVRTLIQTFNKWSEEGSQQHVHNVLETVAVDLYYIAYLEQLERLVEDEGRWDISLAEYTGHELSGKELQVVATIAKDTPEWTRGIFVKLLRDEGFGAKWGQKLAALIES